jgi:hypothetical protein
MGRERLELRGGEDEKFVGVVHFDINRLRDGTNLLRGHGGEGPKVDWISGRWKWM